MPCSYLGRGRRSKGKGIDRAFSSLPIRPGLLRTSGIRGTQGYSDTGAGTQS